jgi:hypothetical protein
MGGWAAFSAKHNLFEAMNVSEIYATKVLE